MILTLQEITWTTLDNTDFEAKSHVSKSTQFYGKT